MLLSDRDVFTCGSGTSGALGHGNSKSQLVPRKVRERESFESSAACVC